MRVDGKVWMLGCGGGLNALSETGLIVRRHHIFILNLDKDIINDLIATNHHFQTASFL